jgi:rubrerythrin
MLSTKVKTTGELMSIALQAEREAVKRYSRLATEMRQAGNESAAALFERMVGEEQEHERLLLEWMEKESIEFNPDIGPVRWRDPQVSTTYNDEARDPHYSTPYKALAFAVNNEENAFRFYTHVAAESDDETVRQYAEILAREELGHAALFRAERRRAFHAERDISPGETAADPRAIQNEIELLATAIEIDRYLSVALTKLEPDSPQLAALARDTRQLISSHETALDRMAPGYSESAAAEIALSFAQADSDRTIPADDSPSLAEELQRLSAYCDQSFVFYDAIVETTTDESMMQTAQALTASALDRIGVLKQVTGTG